MEEKRQHFRQKKFLLHCWYTILLSFLAILPSTQSFNYGEALSKSFIYFESQRSGRLPHSQRATWRHHSGLTDGLEQGVDLVGGYYDAGDNVKFGLPMAFTITMLSWGVIEYGDEIAGAGEYAHALEAIKWGTDYFIKAHTHPNVLWAEVGDGDTDHYCWQRPEDMTTSRHAYKVDEKSPGSDVAGETAAAMAAASIVFRKTNPHYSHLLLHHAQQLFEFGDRFRGTYDESVRVVKGYYPSVSGFKDELLWAALWLYKATDNEVYLRYALEMANEFGGITWAMTEFSWDVKFAGLQIIASMGSSVFNRFILLVERRVKFNNDCDHPIRPVKMNRPKTNNHGRLILLTNKLLMEEKHRKSESKLVLEQYRSKAEYYLCACLNKNNATNVQRTPGGLLYVRQWNNMQYVSNAAFLLTVYSDHLRSSNQQLRCDRGEFSPEEVLNFAKSQVDYILGANPMATSYLVGYGSRYPQRMHHRGGSTESYRQNKGFIGCTQGYDIWFHRKEPNPNVVVGALVGGPDHMDEFRDDRKNFMQTEACTYNTASLVGVLAKLHGLEEDGVFDSPLLASS